MSALTETLNSLHNTRKRMSEDALMWSDVEDKIRDCEEAVALLLKDDASHEGGDILCLLEDLKGKAGAMKLRNQ